MENGRPKRERKLPSRFDDFELDVSCLALLSKLSDVPQSYSEAKDSDHWNCWQKAIDDEINALKNNETWILVEKPNDKKNITNRWVFRVQLGIDNNCVYKACLVARGFEQNFGLYSKIHAPVAKLSITRNKKFYKLMADMEFIQSKSDYCLKTFIKKSACCYLLIYVDDILNACNDKNFINHIIIKLSENIQNLVKRFYVENCKVFKTPIENNLNLRMESERDVYTKLPYKELLGSLMYVMMGTRPDICFSISYIGQFQNYATDEHFQHLLRGLKYLKHTVNYKLYF